ncbi:NAD(P)/FAD-dependent oxidoreductase [Rhizobium sp. 'Codium 1']|uniref:NAD(P)/FAD-dependent oxidoreductase n=1 Tax=Rhizobium sp. 'Codium 1' TaxID=2940484 RepID=UPI001E5EC538|nr:FAD-dependent oxidoreductase [Rhizobium sp. 'Codium 1']MCC8932365.1 FAD-binding oxidoreductase [Rhizobium sp. 'Codium 1']
MQPSLSVSPVWRRPVSPIACRFAEGDVDLVVVGAGYQGLSTALHAARAGLSVQVIEACDIGTGASGVNGGQVIPGLKQDPEVLTSLFGDEAGKQLTRFAARTADVVFDLIGREGLDVEHMRCGWIQAAHTEAALKAAMQRNRQWRAQGADVALLNQAEIALLIGSEGYRGGFLDRRAGVVNPLALVHELARIATEAGADLVTRDPVTSLVRDGTLWRVGTGSGRSLRARKVLLATNAYSGLLFPKLARSLVWLHSFQIATEPLPPEFDTILPGRHAVSDSRRILVYYRRSPDGRLVLGGRGSMRPPRTAEDWVHLERALLRLYPMLSNVAISHRWFGRVAMTPDHLPHLHEPEPGLLMVAGCQGRGIGLMVSLGEPIAHYVATGDPGKLPLPVSPLHGIPLHRFRRIGIAAHVAWYRLLDGLER